MSRTMKDSGVKWIGEIPEGWEVKRLSDIFYSCKRGFTPVYKENTGFRVINQSCLSKYKLDIKKSKETEKTEKNRGKFSKGDILLASTGGGVMGKCVLSEIEGYCDSHVSILKTKEKNMGKLIFFWMRINFDWLQQFGKGSTNQIEFQHKDFMKTGFPLPPLPEQEAIASFLDKETAIIDRKVELIDQKIALLGDKRRALIFEAVTGRLDVGFGAIGHPGGRMSKDSGVEWIGDIPEGWEISLLKNHTTISVGKTPDTSINSYFQGSNSWMTISDFEKSETKKQISDEAIVKYNMKKVKTGSILLSFKLSVGKTMIVQEPIYTNEAIASLYSKNQKNLTNKYVYWFIPFASQNEATENIYGAKILNQAKIQKIKILLPPLPEQEAIASFLDKETALIDREIALLERKKELLGDYRKALIFEYVTGKRAVPGFE